MVPVYMSSELYSFACTCLVHIDRIGDSADVFRRLEEVVLKTAARAGPLKGRVHLSHSWQTEIISYFNICLFMSFYLIIHNKFYGMCRVTRWSSTTLKGDWRSNGHTREIIRDIPDRSFYCISRSKGEMVMWAHISDCCVVCTLIKTRFTMITHTQ